MEYKKGFIYFNQKYNGNLVREGFPSFQEKTSDNPTIILIDTYYQMRLLGPGVRNPAKKELHDIYYNETMAEKFRPKQEEEWTKDDGKGLIRYNTLEKLKCSYEQIIGM